MNFEGKSKGSLRRNVLANYLGQGWRALMAIAFVPLYIRFLGVEAYGLIGIFAVLQAWLGLLDIGIKPALAREMARFMGGAHDAQSIRDLLRSTEFVVIAIAILVTLGVAAASGWLASDWVKGENLSKETVTLAFTIMGVVAGLRFIEDIYASCMVGLQQQVLQNIVSSILATLRGLGAVGVLSSVSPTIQAFFAWQGLISMITVCAFAYAVHRTLPKSFRPARFSFPALLAVWRFAAGMLGITFMTLLLTQVDKILLSRMLSLKDFGYYTFAGTVASTLYFVVGPITTAFYPRFTELVARRDEIAIRATYHQAAQLMTALSGTAAIMLITFGDKILLLWTRDPILTEAVYPLMAVLVIGSLFNGFMWVPYQLQLAYGWTSLTVKLNAVAVCILVPGMVIAATRYGAIGAAWVWVTLNVGYFVFGIYFMHRRLIPADKWRWYSRDVAMPLAAAVVIGGLCRWVVPIDLGHMATFIVLLLSSVLVLTGEVLAAPIVRNGLIRQVVIGF